MVLLVVFFYFALVASAVVLFAFPSVRLRLQATVGCFLGGAGRRLSDTLRASVAMLRWSRAAIHGGAARSVGFVRANRRLSAAALLLLATPPLVAVIARGPTAFSFSEDGPAPDRQISILLRGEHLVPPPSLPPEVFTTREVELVRPDIVHADRDWARLNPEFAQRLLSVMKTMRERHGYQLVLIEGYRSPERQAQLAAMGSQVTNADAYMSYHQYGLASDCAFLRDGKIVLSEQDPWAMRGYQLYGEVAEAAGLHWGGRWKLRDYGHVELRLKGVLGRPAP